MTKRSKC